MNGTKDNRKRSRLRRLTSFSLRTALVAITVLAVWLGLHMNSVRKQQTAIEAIQQHDGSWVTYDYQVAYDNADYVSDRRNRNFESPMPVWLLNTLGRDHFHSGASVHLDAPREVRYDEVVKHLKALPRLEHLFILDQQRQLTDRELEDVGQITTLRTLCIPNGKEITNQGVTYLANLEQLEFLQIGTTQLTDESLRILAQLPKLHSLHLNGTPFTNQGLEHLRDMTQLRRLRLWGTNIHITGDGLSHLRRLKQLKVLELTAPNVTDDGLVYLKHLTQLKDLDLRQSGITDEGLRHLVGLKKLEHLSLLRSRGVRNTSWLKERLPGCEILP